MMTVGKGRLFTASLMAVALAGCATTRHGGLDYSAERLDTNAQAFEQNAAEAPRGYDENSSYTEDARDFADRAHEFHRTVEDPDAAKADVKASFDDLSRSYHALRDDVQHSDSDYARHDLAPVTQAYLDVEDDMGGAPPSRYSDADDDRD
ncbi:MAG TPA: hypothetical protein VHY36_00540 [Steroidobacteraceae bacterium]|nr:hypothetical protein [Steroidobacteraceae bacterium]